MHIELFMENHFHATHRLRQNGPLSVCIVDVVLIEHPQPEEPPRACSTHGIPRMLTCIRWSLDPPGLFDADPSPILTCCEGLTRRCGNPKVADPQPVWPRRNVSDNINTSPDPFVGITNESKNPPSASRLLQVSTRVPIPQP